MPRVVAGEWRTVAHRGRQAADDVLITSLAAGMTAEQAASQAGVGVRTVVRRLADDDFCRRLDAAKQQTVQAAIDRLAAGTTAAATTLVGLMGREHPPSIRLRAAVAVLDTVHKYRTTADLEARLSAVEAALGRQNGREP